MHIDSGIAVRWCGLHEFVEHALGITEEHEAVARNAVGLRQELHTLGFQIGDVAREVGGQQRGIRHAQVVRQVIGRCVVVGGLELQQVDVCCVEAAGQGDDLAVYQFVLAGIEHA